MQSLADAIVKIRARRLAQGIPMYDGPVEPDDTAPDGGPWCAQCRGWRVVRREVDVTDPDFGKAVECPSCGSGVLMQRRLDRMWGDMPEAFRNLRLDTFPATTPEQLRLRAKLQVWLEGDRWLYLHGKPGRGKTGLAVAVLHELIAKGQSGLFKVVPDLLERIRRTYHSRESYESSEQDVLESLYGVGVLVLDDIGSEKSSDWVSEKLFQVVGHRHDHHKRTIITSNLDLRALGEHLGHPRTPSRIDELADVIDLSALPNLRVRAA